jgi:sugar-specific transcriptional regulator TrmB
MERILKSLQDLGLTRDEAEVYVYLAKKGPQTKKTLIETLKKDSGEITIALKGLEEKQITTRKSKQSTLFSAIPFEKLLTNYAKIKVSQIKKIEQKRLTMITDWSETIKENESIEKDEI